jgi:hypothetical protein
MQRFLSLWIALGMAAGSFVARAAGDTNVAELLAHARAAIGGEQQIAKVRGLSCTGTVLRSIGDRQVAGEVTINLQLPDKMMRSDSISPMGDGMLLVTDQGVNGDKLLRAAKTLNAPPGAFIRMPPPPEPGSQEEAQQLRNSRADMARFAISMLLTAPPSFPVEYSYGGEAEAPDGKADVLDIKASGGGTFTARLFLDKSTHRPLMLTYRGVVPRVVVQAQRGGPPPSDAGLGAKGHGGPQAAATATEAVDINMFFDDYKPVDGVMLPHHVTRAVGGETNEEWTFTSIRVNPTFKPDAFSGK